MRKQRKLRIKISKVDRLLLILATVISFAVLVLIFLSLNRYKNNQTDSTIEVITGLAQNQEKQLTEYIDGKITELRALAGFPEIYEMDKDTFSDFIVKKCGNFDFCGLFIVDTKGMAYYPEEYTKKDQSEEEFFKLISSYDTYVTDPFYTNSGPIATICQAIYDTSGTRVGTLCGKIFLDNIQDMVNNNETLLGGHCFILNSNGYYISSADTENVNKHRCAYKQEGNSLTLVQDSFTECSNKTGTITLEGEKYYANVRYISNYNWAVVMCVPVSNVESSYRNVVILQYVLALMIVILCVCVIHMVRCWIRSDHEMCTDVLCKCGSRVACYKMMEELNTSQKAVMVIYADLNHFKSINDTYGHEVGDQALILFAHILMNVYGKYGFVGRMGGDEFIVLLEDMTKEQAEELWKQVKDEMLLDHESLPDGITLSSAHGCAIRTEGEKLSMPEVCQLADQDMYRDKVAGR